MQGRFLFLGTGASTGIPVIGCRCPVCTSGEVRLRPSGLVEVGGKRLLIDVGPDFRQQMLKHQIDRLDGIVLTHAHFDHIAGIDELRVFRFNGEKKIPCLLTRETLEHLLRRLEYLMHRDEEGNVVCKYLDFHILESPFGTTLFQEVNIDYFSYVQVGMLVTGYRFGNLAYVTDICTSSKEVVEAVMGCDILIVDALKEEKSSVHFSLHEALEFSMEVGAKRTYFTHIAHEINPKRVKEKLPFSAALAYDGLELAFEL